MATRPHCFEPYSICPELNWDPILTISICLCVCLSVCLCFWWDTPLQSYIYLAYFQCVFFLIFKNFDINLKSVINPMWYIFSSFTTEYRKSSSLIQMTVWHLPNCCCHEKVRGHRPKEAEKLNTEAAMQRLSTVHVCHCLTGWRDLLSWPFCILHINTKLTILIMHFKTISVFY